MQLVFQSAFAEWDASAGGHGVGLAYLRTRLARETGRHFDLQQYGLRVLARLEIAQ